MDVFEAIKTRRSVREYEDRPVAREALTRLIEAAQYAPSGGNRQPWAFWVVSNPEMKARLNEATHRQEWMQSAPSWIVVCADAERSAVRYEDRGRHLYCIQDSAAAVENILLCAVEMGLGTCWCGAFDEARAAEQLGLPAHLRPVAIVTVGYPARAGAMPRRRPIEEISVYID